MQIEEEQEPEQKPFGVSVLVKAMAILFVIAAYVVIFLKILFLQ